MQDFRKWAVAGLSAALGSLAVATVVQAAPASTTTTTTCAQTGNDMIQNASFTTPQGTFTTLAGHVQPGDTVSATFTVPANCSVEVSLVSYNAPSATYDPNTASQQTVFQAADQMFTSGSHTLSVAVPSCYFQIDFVRGAVITQLGPAGTNNFYNAQGRLLSTATGGTTACSGTSATATPTPTPTPTATPTPTSSVQGITSTPTPGGGNGQVLGASTTTPAVGANLALGMSVLLVLGGILLVAVGRGRRTNI